MYVHTKHKESRKQTHIFPSNEVFVANYHSFCCKCQRLDVYVFCKCSSGYGPRELPSWEEEEVPEDQADDFLLKYASSGSQFKNDTLFILESDQFVENDGQRSYLASEQDVFQWHVQFSFQIKANAEKISFAMIAGGKRYDYTAWKDSIITYFSISITIICIIDNADYVNIIEKHVEHYYSHGTIKSNGSDEDAGDIICSFACGGILECEVEVAEDPFEPAYNIFMERDNSILTRP